MQRSCRRVAGLRSGTIVAQGTVDALTRRSAKYKLTATAVDDALLTHFGGERVNGHLELSVADLQSLCAFIDQIRARGGLVSELAPLRSTLEDVFVDLVRT